LKGFSPCSLAKIFTLGYTFIERYFVFIFSFSKA